MTKPAGVVLAGGLSRRMEGPDKTMMLLAGKPLVQHVCERLGNQTSPLLLNANGDVSRFDFLDLAIRTDSIGGHAGPLAGVLTGMQWASTLPDQDWIITAAADTPFFPENYVEQMIAAKADNQIILATSNGRRHPVFGLWHISLAEKLEAFLQAGDRKVMLFVQEFANSVVDFTSPDRDPFFNVNTPEDWAEATKRVAASVNHD